MRVRLSIKMVLLGCVCLVGSGLAQGVPVWISLSAPGRTMMAASPTSMPDASGGISRVTNAPNKVAVHVQIDGFWKGRVAPDTQTSATTKPPPLSKMSSSGTFDVLHIPGWTSFEEEGQPALPVKRLLFSIPDGAEASAVLTTKTEIQIEPLNVMPVQPPFADVYPEPPRPAFMQDGATYASKVFYPPDNIVTTRVISIRDQRILVVDVAPIRYIPETGRAVAAVDMQIEITTTSPFSMMSDLPDDEDTLPIYMILMDDQFEGNGILNTFIDWKKRKGYDVVVVKTSDINTNGAPGNSEIVSYMRDLADTNYPDYLLIIGDQTAANGVAGYYFSTSQGGYTDLDIACRTNTDHIADLYYGRLPAANNTDATNMLNKALAMDRTPPFSGMYTNVIIAGQIQDKDDHDNRADRLFCETGDAIACFFEQNSTVNYHCTRAVVNPSGMTTNGTWAWHGSPYNSILWGQTNQIGSRMVNHFVSVATAQSRLTSGINAGASLVFHRDHGYSSGAGWGDPYYIYTHVRNLTNGVNRPVVFSINCASGAYHKNNNFTSEWLKHSNGGAYAVFAPVDISYSWLNDWLTHGFMTAFLSNYIPFQTTSTNPDWSNDLPLPSGTYGAPGSALRLGEILNFGKMYLYEKFSTDIRTFRLFHVFGDPETFIQLSPPETLAVSHSSSVSTGAQTLVISTGEAGCDVALYSSSLGIHKRKTTTGTNASFFINPATIGIIHVTVTKPDARPHESEIRVGSDEEFSCSAFALTNSIMLRWTAPYLLGLTNNTIRVNTTTTHYPSNSADGMVIYSGTNTVFEHTGLPQNVPCYYSFWITYDGINWTNPP